MPKNRGDPGLGMDQGGQSRDQGNGDAEPTSHGFSIDPWYGTDRGQLEIARASKLDAFCKPRAQPPAME